MKKMSPVYYVWAAMKNRCSMNSNAMYYGDRNITYQASWESFKNFYADMGDPPEGMELDRKDNNDHYTKENCRWVTHTENMRNSSVTKLTVDKVRLIKGLLRSVMPGVKPNKAHVLISALFKISPQTLWAIAGGHTWKDVK